MAVKKKEEKVADVETPKVDVAKDENKTVDVSLKNEHPSGNHTVFTEEGIASFVEGKATVTQKVKKLLEKLGII